ncbi:hypothetical protein [Formosa haliotis]|uniref:hypothetical protein n=1 Tax=Formosa haliotis TaxID=1555194 RepID=UPI000824E2EC|nr:hypothetical protein [Formosa haliotis]
MKKILLLLLVLVSFSTMYGQNKSQQKKIDYFVNAADKEFNLNESQHKALLDARNAYITDYMGVMKDFKSGSITAEEKKSKLNDVNTNFNTTFSQIAGKTPKELQDFSKRMQVELKKV